MKGLSVLPLTITNFMNPVISVSGLTKRFGDLTAVNDLSFTVNRGDVYGFLGQNGAGKSTTIRMLLTLITPTAGRIEMFGMPLHSHRPEILKKVGAVIEKPDLYKYLSAYENLSIFARMSGIHASRKILMEQLEMVGLQERAHSRVKTFSQGMKQRLGIAVALVHNPDLVVLDEPTNGLDPQGIADIRNLILQLSRKMGKTVLVSSHLLSEIELVANRMLIIHKGEKRVEGNVAELLDPSHTIVQIETADNASAKIKLMQSAWKDAVQPGQEIELKMNKGDVPRLISELVSMDVQLYDVHSTPSLENYFLSLTTQTGHVDITAD